MANTFLAAQASMWASRCASTTLAPTALKILETVRAAGCEIVLPVDVVGGEGFKAHADHRIVPVSEVAADEMIP